MRIRTDYSTSTPRNPKLSLPTTLWFHNRKVCQYLAGFLQEQPTCASPPTCTHWFQEGGDAFRLVFSPTRRALEKSRRARQGDPGAPEEGRSTGRVSRLWQYITCTSRTSAYASAGRRRRRTGGILANEAEKRTALSAARRDVVFTDIKLATGAPKPGRGSGPALKCPRSRREAEDSRLAKEFEFALPRLGKEVN